MSRNVQGEGSIGRNLETLVVGAGPVGLFSALSLLERGVSVQVIDSRGPRLMRGYACALHPATLDRMDRFGLLPAISDQAHCVDRLAIRRPMAPVHWVSLDRRDGGYCCSLTLEQGLLEEILERALEERGSSIVRHEEVTRVSPRDGFVRVTSARAGLPSEPTNAARGAPAETVWDSPFVIGADGANSFCRRALGIELVQLRPTRVFGIYDFSADLRGHERDASICFGPEGAAAFWPLGRNLGRWTFELRDGFAEPPSLQRLQSLVSERAPWFSPRPEQLCWGEVAEFEERLVRRWGNGRVWLAGDAAHCTTPIGFQSMNQGFREADMLSRLISGTLQGAPGRLGAFARFDRAQRAEWRRLVGVDADPMGQRHDPIFPHSEALQQGPELARTISNPAHE
jgi:2-polyprenyl-6-methoxyphenol hydroxylase-like FAD-dependent oxidoreductase